MTETVECQDCKGNKKIQGFGCPGFKPMEIPCPRCEGTGQVPKEMQQWIEHGEKLKAVRREKKLTTRKVSKALNMSMSDYSNIELGKVYNLDFNEAALTALKEQE